MTLELTRFEGACHCRNIRYRLQWPDSATDIPVRKCGCSFCQKHAGAWTSHPDSDLDVEISDLSKVSMYRFGTKTADFYVCSVCGITPLVLSEIDGKQYAIVNVNTFEDVGAVSFSTSPTNFDGENTGGRLQRRKRNWISHVQISASDG